MSKHTPAPWKIGEAKTQKSLAIFQDKAQEDGKIYHAICLISPLDKVEEVDLANAKLIAAAPELLEACNIALRYFNGIDTESQSEAAFHALNNAIKKATL